MNNVKKCKVKQKSAYWWKIKQALDDIDKKGLQRWNVCYYPPRTCGGVPEWPKGADCKSAGTAFEGSNPSPTTINFEELFYNSFSVIKVVFNHQSNE